MGVVHKVKRAAAAAESQMNSTASPPVPASSASPSSKYPRFGKRGAPQAFPSKLYEILEGENPDIVGWTPTGRGFEVRDHARLSAEVLGRFFKQDKFSSFQRQLNLYGFRKITKGSEAGSYQHPHFRRGERTTLLTIRRSTKASPARVVPNSPGSRSTVPDVPLSSSTSSSSPPSPPSSSSSSSSSLSSSLSSPSSSAVPVNNSGIKARPATPSPPPAPVRGILPWPHPPTGTGPPVLLEAVRRVSMGGGSINGITAAAPPANSTRPVDRHVSEGQRQQLGNRGGDTVAWGGVQGRNGPYIDYMGTSPSPGNIQGRWKGGGRALGTAKLGTTSTAATTLAGGMQHSGQGQPWREEAAKKGHERTQELDHRDVEVVGLLQRMAKEAQDSPSRQRSAAASARSTPRPASASPSMSTSRWEGGASNAQTSSLPADASHSHPQAQFRMPRSPPGAGGDQQMASADRLHDIPNQECGDNAPRRPFPYAFGANDRATDVAHQPHAHLPAPFPSSANLKPYHQPPRRGSGDMQANSRGGSTARVHRQHERNPEFETAGHHTNPGRGGGAEGTSRQSFRYSCDFDVDIDSYRRGGSEHWHGRESQYSAPSVSLSFNKYRGDDNGKFGGAVGAPDGSEESWAQHRQYHGGR